VSSTWLILRSFFPPDLAPDYLAALAMPLLETLALVLGAMVPAALFGLILGVAGAQMGRTASGVGAALAAVRAIPELTLAILCVVLFGIGPGAGLVALAIFYGATMAKMFAEILRNVPGRPLDALRTAGASPLQVALYGRLPLASPDLLATGAFCFECAFRASVVVGAVGGGGIGTELTGALAVYDFQRATTLLLVLLAVIFALDAIAVRVRRWPMALVPLTLCGIASLWWLWPGHAGWSHGLDVVREMLPPSLPVEAWQALPHQIGETLAMGVFATGGAALCALPLAMVAARGLSPWWITWPVRRAADMLRTVPEVVWGLMLVAVAGVGPVAGAWALALHSLGSLTRLFAEALDNAAQGPQQALAATGAGRVAVAVYAALPLALPTMGAHLLVRLEWNLRMATVLGLIGAGGLGQALYEAQQLMFYPRMLAYVLVTAVIILVLEMGMRGLRRYWERGSWVLKSQG